MEANSILKKGITYLLVMMILASTFAILPAAGVQAAAAQNTYSPQGSLDLVRSGAGTVTVAGWAFDDDLPTAPVNIHVYIGGPAGAAGAEGHAIGTAAASRPDVGAIYSGRGNSHGFSKTFTTNKRGVQEVYVYAINIDGAGSTGGSNVLLGKSSVTITSSGAQNTHSPQGYLDLVRSGGRHGHGGRLGV